MTATNELREMLDERGIEYEQSRIEGIAEYTHVTKWKMWTGNKCTFYEIEDGYPPYFTRMFIETPTAEQAIDATMGDDTPVYLCPKCGVAYELDFIDKEFGKPNYCPHCGYRRLYV